jgi:hypothetical protein
MNRGRYPTGGKQQLSECPRCGKNPNVVGTPDVTGYHGYCGHCGNNIESPHLAGRNPYTGAPIEDTAEGSLMEKSVVKPLDISWNLLKNMTTDMYEYPKGSGSFVAYDQLPQGSLEKIEADNQKSRDNLQNVTRQPVGAHAPHLQQHYSNQNSHTPPSSTNDPLGRALEAARNRPPTPRVNITSPDSWNQGAGGQ